MLGDVIGTPGLKEIFLKLEQVKKREHIHLAIVNGENSDEGFGITEQIISNLKEYGINVITSGNHIWSNSNAEWILDNYDYMLRPANYPNVAGKGYWIDTVNGIEIAVVNLMGRYFMTPIDCPFQTLNKLLNNQLKKCSIIIVDFHAEFVAEKKALAHEFDGRISLFAGTHTHVQSADEMILPKGTGYITDLGLCGSINSVIGMIKEDVIRKVITQTMIPYEPSTENCHMQGIVAQIDTETFKTVNIKRIDI